jgi:hypothetical protein
MSLRQETLNFVRTPYRFNLSLSDKQLIGKRRCAQKVMAKVLDLAKNGSADASDESSLVEAAKQAVADIAKTWGL